MWCSTYHRKWNNMYYPYRIFLPSNILKLIPLYMKQPWVHYPNLCATRICYQTFSKGWHQSLRVEICWKYGNSREDAECQGCHWWQSSMTEEARWWQRNIQVEWWRVVDLIGRWSRSSERNKSQSKEVNRRRMTKGRSSQNRVRGWGQSSKRPVGSHSNL